MLIGVVFGYLSTQLGLAYVTAFALGDFVLGQRIWRLESRFSLDDRLLDQGLLGALVQIRIPMLIGYLVFAALVVLIPMLCRTLLADLPRADRLPAGFAAGLAVLLTVLLVFIGVRLWAEAAAVLIRPLFTWQADRSPVAEPITPLQEDGIWVVRAAVLATLARAALLWRAWSKPAGAERVAATERALAEPAEPAETVPWLDRAHPALRAVGAAGVVTLLLAGLIPSWSIAGLLFGEFLLLRLLAAGVIPPRLDGWRRLVGRVPVLIRLAVALLIVDTLSDAFVSEQDETFGRLAIYVGASVAILCALIPGRARGASVPPGRERAAEAAT